MGKYTRYYAVTKEKIKGKKIMNKGNKIKF